MIKLIALDLDGTLLNDEKQVTTRTKEVIQKAKDQGIKVVLCTGRPLGGIRHLLEELNLLEEGDYSITYNGGLVQQNIDGSILSERILTLEQANEIYALSQSLQIPMNLIDREAVYEPTYPVGRDSFYPSLMTSKLPFLKRELSDFEPDKTFNKIVFCYEVDVLDEAIAKIPPSIKASYSMMKSRPVLFEIMNPEVNKAFGISVLCEELQISPNEVMACGDEENDLAMLEFAGLGVAMANASEEVKTAATVVTKSNNEDGVAHAIETWALAKDWK